MTSDAVSVLKLSTQKETRGRTGENGKGEQDCASEVRWVGVSGRESGQTGSNRGKSDPSVERPVRCSTLGECAARGYLGLFPMGRSVERLSYGKKDGYLNQLAICASGHCTSSKEICSGSYPLGTLPHPTLPFGGGLLRWMRWMKSGPKSLAAPARLASWPQIYTLGTWNAGDDLNEMGLIFPSLGYGVR